MVIIINGKKLYNRQITDDQIELTKIAIAERKNVLDICAFAGVTAHTVKAVREGILNGN